MPFPKTFLFPLISVLWFSCSTNELPPCGDADCVSSCSKNDDCEPGLTCQSFQFGEVLICAEPPLGINNGVNPNKGTTTNNKKNTNNNGVNPNNSVPQTTNHTTPTNNGTTSTNNATTSAKPPAITYAYLMLRDNTVGKGCGAISSAGPDPGSDIMWISLLDNNGQTLDYAVSVSAFDGGKANGHNNPGIINGSAPQTNAIGCTEKFNPMTVYSMGCGGTLIFRFPSLLATEELHTIVVGEYGSTCNGSSEDSYRVFGCTDPTRAAMGETLSCTVRFGPDGEGISSFPIPKTN